MFSLFQLRVFLSFCTLLMFYNPPLQFDFSCCLALVDRHCIRKISTYNVRIQTNSRSGIALATWCPCFSEWWYQTNIRRLISLLKILYDCVISALIHCKKTHCVSKKSVQGLTGENHGALPKQHMGDQVQSLHESHSCNTFYNDSLDEKNGFTNVCERCNYVVNLELQICITLICAVGLSVGKYIYLLVRY